jgi:hypothetical protein
MFWHHQSQWQQDLNRQQRNIYTDHAMLNWAKDVFFLSIFYSRGHSLTTLTKLIDHTYSRVPNKRTGRLLENEKKIHLYTLIQTYTFINFQQKVPPTYTIIPTYTLSFLVLSLSNSITF